MAFSFSLKAQEISESLYDEMKKAAEIYTNSDSTEERKEALKKMNDIDKEIKFQNAVSLIQEFDTVNSLGSDYRRAAIVLQSSGFNDYADWFYLKGAEKGEPYCLNHIIVDLMKSEKEPLLAIGLFQNIKNGSTPPLLYNMALILCSTDSEVFNRVGKEFAQEYYKFMNEKDRKFGPYDLDLYLDYIPAENLYEWGNWIKPYDHKTISRRLEKLLEM